MKTVKLPSGKEIPILGQGTWRMGEKASQKQAEIDALKLAACRSNQKLLHM